MIRNAARNAIQVAAVAAAWRHGYFKIFRVRGYSMHPTLAQGDYVVVDTRASESVEPGAIVVAREPREQTIVIKRVRSRGDSTMYLGSDDPTVGRDSRHFGSVPNEAVIGPVTLHLPLSRLSGLRRTRRR